MFKYTIMTAAVVVVLASLANSLSTNSTQTNTAPAKANLYDHMSGQETASHMHKQMRPVNRGGLANNGNSRQGGGGGGGGGLIEAGLSGLLEAISIPKRIIVSVIGKVGALLSSIDLKRVVKILAVVVLGAVAFAGAAGLAAIVTAVCAIYPYVRFFFGGNAGEASPSEMDNISMFVMDAFNKYGNQHNGHE